MKLWDRLKKHRNIYALVISIALGVSCMLFLNIWSWCRSGELFFYAISAHISLALLLGVLIIYPLALTCLNLLTLFQKADCKFKKDTQLTAMITLVLGIIYTLLYVNSSVICFQTNWQIRINAGYLHAPIWTKAALTIMVCSIIGIAGYLLLSVRNINSLPPLVAVCGISAIYIGILMCVLWIIQISPEAKLLCLLPLNCIFIGIRTIQNAIRDWQGDEDKQTKIYKNKILNSINEMLMNSSRWPVAAFLLMWPLLGILIVVLTLFGQQPDSIIKAWTETSDWTLSQQIAPPDFKISQHYLCTVAAQGHANVVKPLRNGIRHGHPVTVNRQLCIANAFEQVLEERLPWLHRPVRRYYDKYGFPVSKLVHPQSAADVIYILMKPLEWLFLVILYLVDVKPENRIAVQYPHTPIPPK